MFPNDFHHFIIEIHKTPNIIDQILNHVNSTDSIKEEKFKNDLELGYNNMAANLGLYGLAPAMRMAANFSSLGANPFSFPNLTANTAGLGSVGGNAAQTAEDAMAKLWSPFFNAAAAVNQQTAAGQNNAANTTPNQSAINNSSGSTTSSSNLSTNSITNTTINNFNLSNIVNSNVASPFASAFNPLFSPLAGFQPFDITQAMRLSAQNNSGTNNSNSNSNQIPALDTTRSMLNAYINDLNNEQQSSTTANSTSANNNQSITSISSALNGLNNQTNVTNSLPNNFNFDLFSSERYKAAAGILSHRFYPYNLSKPFFNNNNNQQQNSNNPTTLTNQCNSNTNNITTNSPSVNNPLSTNSINSNGTLSNNTNPLKNPFTAFGNFNLNNLNSSFGLSSAFPGLNLNNLNNLSSNLFNNPTLANLAATPINTSLTSSTASTGLLTNTSINSPLTPRAPSTPLSASSLSDCNANSLLNGSNSMNSTNLRSSPRSNGASNRTTHRPSSGCSKDELPDDEELENSKLSCNNVKSTDDKQASPEQMQLKNMERMVECLNQSSNQSTNSDLNPTTAVHLTNTSTKLNGNAVPTAT